MALEQGLPWLILSLEKRSVNYTELQHFYSFLHFYFQQQCVHTHRHQHCLTCVLSALITEFEEQN